MHPTFNVKNYFIIHLHTISVIIVDHLIKSKNDVLP